MSKGLKKILAVSLGGTIASSFSEDTVVLGGTSISAAALENIDRRFSVSLINPISYSSENATVSDYRTALSFAAAEASKIHADAILFMHGTDSMAYFAQLAVRCLSYLDIPVVITGSKRPPEQDGSDAVKNLQTSMGILSAAIKDKSGARTFGIVFEDSYTGVSSFVDATQCSSPDVNGDIVTFVDRSSDEYAKFKKRKKAPFANDTYKDLAKSFFKSDKDIKIAIVPAVPGQTVLNFAGADAVLIEAYHSGTADIKLKDLLPKDIPVYMAPVPSNCNVYESRKILEVSGVKVLPGIPFEGAWAEAVLQNA